MGVKAHAQINLKFPHTLMYTKWRWAGNSSVVKPKLIFEGKQMIPFKAYFAVSQVTTRFTLEDFCTTPKCDQAVLTQSSKSFATCPSVNSWTKHHTLLSWAPYKKQVFPLMFFPSIFTSRIGQPSGKGSQGSSCLSGCPRAHLHPSLSREHFRRANPSPSSRVCVAAWAKHTGPGLNCYWGKFILSRFGCVRRSCSHSFGLPYSSRFPGTSVSLGSSQRQKGCFVVDFFFFLITTLTYPRHMLLHETEKVRKGKPSLHRD